MTAAWGVITTVILLYAIEKTVGIRLTREEEQQGCDLVEHGIGEEDEDEDGDKGEVDTGEQTKRPSALKRSTLTEVEKFSNEGSEASGERKFTGAFVMRLPFIARALRLKNRNTKPLKEELSGAQPTRVESSADARKNKEDSPTPDDSSPPRVMSTKDIRRENDDTRVSDDVQSIYSIETDIEELLRRDGETSCYVMNAKKPTMDKCTQVACEHGMLFEL